MSSRSLHRPSLIAPGEEHDVDAPRVLNLAAANHSIAATPFLITQLRPFVPFTSCRPGEPFTTKAAWKGVISGIRALQRLRITGGAASGPLGALKSDLVVISAHEQGHVMVWSADTLHAIGSCTHYNNVTVQQIVVTKSQIFTRVERNMVNGKAGDDDEVYVWDLSTMTLKCKLSGHEDRVTALAVLDEDENICVSGGLDKTILLWDVSHPAKPTGKLTGHNSSVTALLLSGHLLVSGSADGFIKTWNTTTKACIATIEGHQGIVTFLQWAKSYKDAIREMQKQQQQQPEGSAAEEEVHPFGVCIGACSGGVLRSYNCNKVELTSSWQVKAHRAFTTDVCWDDNIYISSSMAEPAINFYREGRSVNYKGHTGGEAGVRHLAIDRAHKVVMGGTDAGLLCFWSYKGLIGDADLDTDTVTLILSLQPHLGSISNLLLERAENSQWERLVSVSNDNTIFCMDFDVNRDSKSFHGVGLRCGVVAVPWSGSVVTASENNIMVWDSDAMAKRALPKKTFDGHTEPISALRFSIQASRLISGANDKTIRCWDVLSVAADGSSSSAAATEVDSDVMPKAPEELFVPAWTIDVGSPVTCLSEASSNVIVAGSRKANSKMGFVSVIDINSGNEVVGAIPVSVFPIAATVLVQSDGSPRTDEQKASGWIAPVVFSKPGEASANASPERSFGASTAATVLPDVSTPAAPTGPRNIIVVVQLRTGEIQVATITASGQGVNTATPFRTIAPAQLEFFHGEAEDRIEMPSGYLALLGEKYDPPRVTVLYASDSKTVRKDEIVPPSATRPDISRTTSFATALLSKMDVLAHINQSGIYCAAGCDMGTGYLLNGAGEIIFKVRYDGGVIDVAAEELRPARSRRCYYRLPGDQNAEAKQLHQRFPGCTFIRATPEARSIAFGYNDGMVQIFDIVQRRVCRRISAHGTIIRSCFVMPATPRIVSLSKTGSLRFDTLYGRHVKHQGTTSASAVVAAFAGQS